MSLVALAKVVLLLALPLTLLVGRFAVLPLAVPTHPLATGCLQLLVICFALGVLHTALAIATAYSGLCFCPHSACRGCGVLVLGVFFFGGKDGPMASGPQSLLSPSTRLLGDYPWEVDCGSVAMVTSLLLRRVLSPPLLPLRHLPSKILVWCFNVVLTSQGLPPPLVYIFKSKGGNISILRRSLTLLT